MSSINTSNTGTIILGREQVSTSGAYFEDKLEEKPKNKRDFSSRLHGKHNEKLMRLDRGGNEGVSLSALRSVEIV